MSEIRLIHLHQKGAELDFDNFLNIKGNGRITLGSKIAPKTFTIIYYVELGKPCVFLLKVLTP